MAALEVRGTKELVGRLPAQAVQVSLVTGSAEEGEDGTWSVVAYADEDQVPALEALGYTVSVVTSDTTLLAMWDGIDGDPPVA
jgi:hypothetical protein